MQTCYSGVGLRDMILLFPHKCLEACNCLEENGVQTCLSGAGTNPSGHYAVCLTTAASDHHTLLPHYFSQELRNLQMFDYSWESNYDCQVYTRL